MRATTPSITIETAGIVVRAECGVDVGWLAAKRLCARPRPAGHLAGLCGILQVDGYGAYAQLAQHGDVALEFSWSHVRRQFYEIQAKTPTQALVRFAALYAIEADIRGLSADECRQARQRRTKSFLDDLRLRLEARLAAVSGKATIAGAIRYTLSRWDGLIIRPCAH